jgi:hypothetical protein
MLWRSGEIGAGECGESGFGGYQVRRLARGTRSKFIASAEAASDTRVWSARQDGSTQHCGEYGESIKHNYLQFLFVEFCGRFKDQEPSLLEGVN